ncbi:MAG: hypothetical protein V4597_11585 [Pseudomonadota bacterium]
MTTVTFKGTGSGGNSVYQEMTNLGSQRFCQLEAPGFEMGRSGRSFAGGLQLVTSAIVPLVDLPTTGGAGTACLFNGANPGANPPRYLAVKRISFSYGSGTAVAFGTSLFAGVTPSVLATAMVANGTNWSIQATRGTGASVAFLAAAQTIPAGTAWMLLGGIAHGAATTMAFGYTVDISAHPFIVPPGFALTFGALAGLGTTAKYLFSLSWDECEAILP